ncbi:MAG: glycosyltransferase family 1 protein [Desulfobacteraceae bacterium]|nr:MAG: glycosyltransferase family 1 protein [Desulfobacteraceae bacterium]
MTSEYESTTQPLNDLTNTGKIRVLHLHTLPIVSGSGINTFLSMKGLDKDRYEVEFGCAPGGRLNELVASNGIRVKEIKNFVQPLNPIKDLLALVELTLFLKKNRYHIIHTHNSKAGFIGRLAGKLASVPIVVHTVHGFSFHDQEPFWKRKLLLNLERIASRWCDRMIFISQPLIDWGLRERVARIDKIVKIYSGIELEKFRLASEGETNRLRKKWGIALDEAVIGIVSKLWEGKGHAVLIRAFSEVSKHLPNSKLVIVGEGDLKNELESLSSAIGMNGRVLFTGFQANVRDLLACFDVAVLPSFFEGMGRVLLEAMAMEKPVVGTRVGGIPDLIDDGVNGFLIEPANVMQLSSSILRILNDKDLARQMGRAGRKKIQAVYSAEYMVRAIDDVYRRLFIEKGIQYAS